MAACETCPARGVAALWCEAECDQADAEHRAAVRAAARRAQRIHLPHPTTDDDPDDGMYAA